jgi:D-glycero-alpha-D-manno-heptose-7-phosphate kinase
VLTALHRIKALALEMRACLERDDLAGFGQLLDQGWQHKKALAGGITTPAIDAAYATARAHGAWGGKITGAGGGGFLLLCCPPERQAVVTQALHGHGLQRMAFRFANRGATVLLHDTTMRGDTDIDRGASYPAARFVDSGLPPTHRNGTGVMQVGTET